MTGVFECKRVLLIGGPPGDLPENHGGQKTIERIGCDIPSLLGGPPLHDFHHVVLWPDESFLDLSTEDRWKEIEHQSGPSLSLPMGFWELLDRSKRKENPSECKQVEASTNELLARTFRERERALLAKVTTAREAKSLLDILESRATERLHDIIRSAVNGSVHFIVVSPEMPPAGLNWLDPSLIYRDSPALIVTPSLPALSPEPGWHRILRQVWTDAINEWPIVFRRAYYYPDADETYYAEFSRPVTGDEEGNREPPRTMNESWITALCSRSDVDRDAADPLERDNESRYLFTEDYFARKSGLRATYDCLLGISNGAGEALSVVYKTGAGCLCIVPKPTTLSTLIQAIVRSPESSGGTEDSPQNRTTTLKTLQYKLQKLGFPESLKQKGRGRPIVIRDVEALRSAILKSNSREDLCRNLKRPRYSSEKIDEIRKKLRDSWSRHEQLKEFCDVVLEIITLLPPPGRPVQQPEL